MSSPYAPDGTALTHDDWCLIGVDDLGKYHDPRYVDEGGALTAWQLEDHGECVLNKFHEMLGFGKAGSENCELCLKRYGP